MSTGSRRPAVTSLDCCTVGCGNSTKSSMASGVKGGGRRADVGFEGLDILAAIASRELRDETHLFSSVTFVISFDITLDRFCLKIVLSFKKAANAPVSRT